jgi:hypothetical protein
MSADTTDIGTALLAIGALGSRTDGWAMLARVALRSAFRSADPVSCGQLCTVAIFYAGHAPGQPMQVRV